MKRSAIQWEIISSRLHNFELIFEIQEVELQCGLVSMEAASLEMYTEVAT